MPAKRLSMRKIREVLRLRWANGLSKRKTAQICGISRPAVDEYERRAEAAGLSWPLPGDLDEGALERLLFPAAPVLPAQERGLPDWVEINREWKRKGVTLFLLWQEYRAHHPEGYQYSWFCEQYRHWQGKQDLVMRQDHRAGEKLFVDYAGQTVPVVDRYTGEIREAQVFVAVLGASNYTYAEATWSQGLPDWIGSHQRAFQYLGGVPEIVVPDYVVRNIIVDHSLWHTAEEGKGAIMGIKNHLLALPWIGCQVALTAMGKTEMRQLDGLHHAT
jgi:transposase